MHSEMRRSFGNYKRRQALFLVSRDVLFTPVPSHWPVWRFVIILAPPRIYNRNGGTRAQISPRPRTLLAQIT